MQYNINLSMQVESECKSDAIQEIIEALDDPGFDFRQWGELQFEDEQYPIVVYAR